MTRRLLFLLFLAPALASAAPVLESVTLRHRPADEVAAMVRPLAAQGVSVLATGNEILLRGEATQLSPLIEAIRKLDVAARSLIISVREGGAVVRESRGGAARGPLANPEIRIHATESRDHPQTLRQVRTLENQWARVSAGTAFPVAQQSTIVTPYGAASRQSTEYKEVESGFEVRPRLAGNGVIVDVRAFTGQLARQGGGVVESSSVESTLQGPLGEWLDLGGAVEELRRDEQGLVYSTRSRERRLGHTQIKVEIAP